MLECVFVTKMCYCASQLEFCFHLSGFTCIIDNRPSALVVDSLSPWPGPDPGGFAETPGSVPAPLLWLRFCGNNRCRDSSLRCSAPSAAILAVLPFLGPRFWGCIASRVSSLRCLAPSRPLGRSLPLSLMPCKLLLQIGEFILYFSESKIGYCNSFPELL